MLRQIADGVLVHESEFLQSNSVVVQGVSGVLLVDPGITRDELVDIASGIDQQIVAGFSTHPDWDHVLWHPRFGDVPRYGTARNAASMAELLATPNWSTLVAGVLPPEHADEIPMEQLGLITALPAGSTELPWHGPHIRIIEHSAHATGHAALFIEESGVLIAGDMLSDILMPFLDLDADDPIGDYLAALRLFEELADDVSIVIPGHGSVGTAGQLQARIDLDRSYVEALLDDRSPDDPRIGPDAPLYWLPDVHDFQVQRLEGKTR
jgi:glyoxylase-like metal-dependent hydrolase (beta-lactamase superfamily II)